MRVVITLILLILILLIANVYVAIFATVGWSSLLHVITCFMNVIMIAGIISSCELWSSWLAYILTASLFLLLAILGSAPLLDVMRHLAVVIESYRVLPTVNSEVIDERLNRLSVALAISCPPFVGIFAAFVAILCFPGRRRWPSIDKPYK